MNPNFRVRISKNGFELELESTEKDFVETKLTQLLPSSIQNTMSVSVVSKVSKKPLSLNEFLMKVSPKSAIDYAVAIAFYLEKIESLDSFTARDIKESFRKVKHGHSNPSQALLDAKTRGLVMTTSDAKHYTITGTGEEWVKERLKSTVV